MSKRAVIYGRVSYDDRDNDGRNLPGQLTMGREYCTKRGYPIIIELAENEKGASGAEINLPQLTRIREMARAGAFDVLVVRELDRLSRNLAKQLTIEEELKRYGVMVEYVLYDYPDTPEGRLMKNIRASFAEFEREKIRERMIRGKRHKVKAGNVLVSTGAPYGYRVIEKGNVTTFEPDPVEAAIVKQIFIWFAHDALPIREIVRRLNEIDAPSPKSGGAKRRGGWPRSTINRILNHSVYMGIWRYTYDHTEELTVEVTPVISLALWEAAQSRLDANKERMARATRYDYLFGRRLKCASCGRWMALEPQKSRGKLFLYYVCPGAEHNRLNHCPGMRVRVDAVDGTAWLWIAEILRDPQRLQSEIDLFQGRALRENAPTLEQLKITDELLADHRSKYQRLIDLYISGDFPREELAERKTRLEQTIKSLETQQKDLSAVLNGKILTSEQIADLHTVANELGERLDGATHEQRLQLFHLLNVGGMLAIEAGEKVLYLSCMLRPVPDSVMIDNTATKWFGRGIAILPRFHG